MCCNAAHVGKLHRHHYHHSVVTFPIDIQSLASPNLQSHAHQLAAPAVTRLRYRVGTISITRSLYTRSLAALAVAGLRAHVTTINSRISFYTYGFVL